MSAIVIDSNSSRVYPRLSHARLFTSRILALLVAEEEGVAGVVDQPAEALFAFAQFARPLGHQLFDARRAPGEQEEVSDQEGRQQQPSQQHGGRSPGFAVRSHSPPRDSNRSRQRPSAISDSVGVVPACRGRPAGGSASSWGVSGREPHRRRPLAARLRRGRDGDLDAPTSGNKSSTPCTMAPMWKTPNTKPSGGWIGRDGSRIGSSVLGRLTTYNRDFILLAVFRAPIHAAGWPVAFAFSIAARHAGSEQRSNPSCDLFSSDGSTKRTGQYSPRGRAETNRPRSSRSVILYWGKPSPADGLLDSSP